VYATTGDGSDSDDDGGHYDGYDDMSRQDEFSGGEDDDVIDLVDTSAEEEEEEEEEGMGLQTVASARATQIDPVARAVPVERHPDGGGSGDSSGSDSEGSSSSSSSSDSGESETSDLWAEASQDAASPAPKPMSAGWNVQTVRPTPQPMRKLETSDSDSEDSTDTDDNDGGGGAGEEEITSGAASASRFQQYDSHPTLSSPRTSSRAAAQTLRARMQSSRGGPPEATYIGYAPLPSAPLALPTILDSFYLLVARIDGVWYPPKSFCASAGGGGGGGGGGQATAVGRAPAQFDTVERCVCEGGRKRWRESVFVPTSSERVRQSSR
jgi:hypothetical protein